MRAPSTRHRKSAALGLKALCATAMLLGLPTNPHAVSPREESVNIKTEHATLPNAQEIASLPPDGGAEFNRLIFEKSPYLLQHARNPVDWYPWGDEAFERARKEGKPVFLSVGYSTCHWCHVMERESFENEAIADVLNQYFIAIKVDREERPDIDDIYMTATQLFTQQGGWPNSVWLTPEGQPWFCGTYFPPVDGYGRPGFKTLLLQLGKAWDENRETVLQQAERVAEAMQQYANASSQAVSNGNFSRGLVDNALQQLDGDFDSRHGGFGSQPKFPPHNSLNLIFGDRAHDPNEEALQIATTTLDAMALGGIHDHVGGGFHRYSTDARWFLPHFEKMLYDNAQLGRAYVDGYRATGDENYRRVATGIFDWILRDMTSPEGGFYSALDADSEGEEGKFYLWEPSEIRAILGEEEGSLFCRLYNIEDEGNYAEEAGGHRPGTSIAYLQSDLETIAKNEGIPHETLTARLRAAREGLLAVRNKRIWPHLDDKVLTSWNGLAIGSLAYGAKHLGEPRYLAAAERCADFVLTTLRRDERLLRTYRNGEAKLNAYLDDYIFLIDGLLTLHETSGDARWLDESQILMQTVLAFFQDETLGGFYFTSKDHEKLLYRTKKALDNAVPSGNGIAAQALVRLANITGKARYSDLARKTMTPFLDMVNRAPRATESLVLAAALYLDASARGGSQNEPTSGKEPGSEASFSITQGPVTIEATAPQEKLSPGMRFEIDIRIAVDEGWHINSNQPLQSYLMPTELVVQKEMTGITLDSVEYPAGEAVTLAFSRDSLSVYEGTVTLVATCTLSPEAHSGSTPLRLSLNTQACNDSSCQAPQSTTITLPIAVE